MPESPPPIRIGIPTEVRAGERRVAATPETVRRLIKLGFEVAVECGAGAGAAFSDEAYAGAGAWMVGDARTLWAESDLILKVQPPELNPDLGVHEVELLREGGTLISFLWPAKNPELLERLAARRATALAMDLVPRITRAQKMDALSSMANISGYRAVIEAASFYGRFFTGQMTAAGQVPPAKVLVIGAGVAGLSAIGAARGLGAVVRAFDTRAASHEQVESLGAQFLTVEMEEDGTGAGGYGKTMTPEYIAAEIALLGRHAKEVDIIITTALIPNRPAPVLLTREIVESMRPGSVIVDVAAENGGNCELTRPGEVVVHSGVTVIGYVDLPSRLAPVASQLYGTNLAHLLADMGGGRSWHVDQDDAVVRGALVLHDGALTWPPPRPATPPAPVAAAVPPAVVTVPKVPPARTGYRWAVAGLVALGLVLWAGALAPPSFLQHFTVFVLACLVGRQLVWDVTPALHTPLMSVTNAISGIILIGGMLDLAGPLGAPATILGAIAVLIATINVAGGFWVTQRMLRMFQR